LFPLHAVRVRAASARAASIAGTLLLVLAMDVPPIHYFILNGVSRSSLA
jgi:hypothetical protein